MTKEGEPQRKKTTNDATIFDHNPAKEKNITPKKKNKCDVCESKNIGRDQKRPPSASHRHVYTRTRARADL